MRSEADVIVVGAGIIGAAIAWELARRGVRVAILDARGAGAGATQASAGVLAPYIEAPREGALHELTVRSLACYDDFVNDVRREVETPLEYRRCGTVEVADADAGVARLTALASWTAAAGVAAEWLSPREVSALEPALAPCEGALLVPTHGYVRAAQLTAALLEAAGTHGAVLDAARVGRIDAGQTAADVHTDAGVYHAPVAVIAAGSWSQEVGPDGPPVRPVRGQLLQLQWHGRPITRVLWSERCYIVPWTDGTVLVGATVEDVGFDERRTVAGVRDLLDAACELMPEAWGATFVDARVGLRPATPDGLPIIGRSPTKSAVIYATGHYRNGILLAPLTARLVADLIVDRRDDPALTLTSPSRFR
jgi:glycine oxidase